MVLKDWKKVTDKHNIKWKNTKWEKIKNNPFPK